MLFNLCSSHEIQIVSNNLDHQNFNGQNIFFVNYLNATHRKNIDDSKKISEYSMGTDAIFYTRLFENLLFHHYILIMRIKLN